MARIKDPTGFLSKWAFQFAQDEDRHQYLHVLLHEIPWLFQQTPLNELPFGLRAFSNATEETWVCLSKGM